MDKRTRDLIIGVVLFLAAGTAGAFVMMQKPRSAGDQQTEFAANRSSTPSGSASVPFDGSQAMQYIRQICALGPRISHTPQHKQMVEKLHKHFKDLGAEVTLQHFEGRQRSKTLPVPMVNLIVRFQPEKKLRLLVCTHYDTRPLADNEPNARDWNKPFLGANDGGSGVAWMMEMAKHMKQLNPPLGVDFVCFDGEEYIFDNRPSSSGGDRYFLGSEYFAQEHIRSMQTGNSITYKEGVLLDMIAGRNPRFLLEKQSSIRAPDVLDRIWRIAVEQHCPAFVRVFGQDVLDDHIELHKANLKVIDIIPTTTEREAFGMSYPFWHKLGDTPENCAPEGMEQVAKVLAVWMKTTTQGQK
jgi:hypothetical protein